MNQELPDGRSNIVVFGGERFVLTRAMDDAAPYYRRAWCRPFDEEPGSDAAGRDRGPAARAVHRLLRAAPPAQRRRARGSQPARRRRSDSRSTSPPAIECDPGVKQRLLVERSTARRVEALLMLVPILTAAVESALRVHRRAHTNGRGGARPDVLTEP